MSVTRVDGQRAAHATPSPVPVPGMTQPFARRLESRRAARPRPASSAPPPTPSPTPARGQTPPHAAQRASATSVTRQAPARATVATPGRVTARPAAAIEGQSPGPRWERSMERVLARVCRQQRRQRGVTRFGLIEETVVSIEGLGDVVVTVHRMPTGWVVKAHADGLVHRLLRHDL